MSQPDFLSFTPQELGASPELPVDFPTGTPEQAPLPIGANDCRIIDDSFLTDIEEMSAVFLGLLSDPTTKQQLNREQLVGFLEKFTDNLRLLWSGLEQLHNDFIDAVNKWQNHQNMLAAFGDDAELEELREALTTEINKQVIIITGLKKALDELRKKYVNVSTNVRHAQECLQKIAQQETEKANVDKMLVDIKRADVDSAILLQCLDDAWVQRALAQEWDEIVAHLDQGDFDPSRDFSAVGRVSPDLRSLIQSYQPRLRQIDATFIPSEDLHSLQVQVTRQAQALFTFKNTPDLAPNVVAQAQTALERTKARLKATEDTERQHYRTAQIQKITADMRAPALALIKKMHAGDWFREYVQTENWTTEQLAQKLGEKIKPDNFTFAMLLHLPEVITREIVARLPAADMVNLKYFAKDSLSPLIFSTSYWQRKKDDPNCQSGYVDVAPNISYTPQARVVKERAGRSICWRIGELKVKLDEIKTKFTTTLAELQKHRRSFIAEVTAVETELKDKEPNFTREVADVTTKAREVISEYTYPSTILSDGYEDAFVAIDKEFQRISREYDLSRDYKPAACRQYQLLGNDGVNSNWKSARETMGLARDPSRISFSTLLEEEYYKAERERRVFDATGELDRRWLDEAYNQIVKIISLPDNLADLITRNAGGGSANGSDSSYFIQNTINALKDALYPEIEQAARVLVGANAEFVRFQSLRAEMKERPSSHFQSIVKAGEQLGQAWEDLRRCVDRKLLPSLEKARGDDCGYQKQLWFEYRQRIDANLRDVAQYFNISQQKFFSGRSKWSFHGRYHELDVAQIPLDNEDQIDISAIQAGVGRLYPRSSTRSDYARSEQSAYNSPGSLALFFGRQTLKYADDYIRFILAAESLREVCKDQVAILDARRTAILQQIERVRAQRSSQGPKIEYSHYY